MNAKKWGIITTMFIAAGIGFAVAFTHPGDGSSSFGSSAAVLGGVLCLLSAVISTRAHRAREREER